jgi:hypothetical protein
MAAIRFSKQLRSNRAQFVTMPDPAAVTAKQDAGSANCQHSDVPGSTSTMLQGRFVLVA